MKIKRSILRLSVALLGFFLGVANYLEFQVVRSYFGSREAQPFAVSQIALNENVPEIGQPPTSTNVRAETTDTEQEPPSDFDATGSYYTLEDDLPKGFNTFAGIYVEMRDYDNSDEEAPYGVPIVPRGSIQFRKEYKFTRIGIAGKEIGFETEKIDGISYRFTGRFTEEQNSENEYVPVHLRGRLTKLKNGKKVAETDLNLYVGGC